MTASQQSERRPVAVERQLNGTSAQRCVGTFSKRHRRGTDGQTDGRTYSVTSKWPPKGGPLKSEIAVLLTC